MSGSLESLPSPCHTSPRFLLTCDVIYEWSLVSQICMMKSETLEQIFICSISLFKFEYGGNAKFPFSRVDLTRVKYSVNVIFCKGKCIFYI